MKTLPWFVIGVLLSASPALARGIVTLTLTPGSASDVSATVRIDLSITDTGDVPDCSGMEIWRRAVFPCDRDGPDQVVQSIPRELGTRNLQILDVVAPNTSYAYTVVPTGEGCVPHFFYTEFSPYNGWPEAITTYISVGPDPTPLAHGRFVSSPEDPAVPVHLVQCTDSCVGVWAAGCGPEVSQNCELDTDLLLYGTAFWADNAVGWVLVATSAVPQPCTLAVESRTWSNLKLLYR